MVDTALRTFLKEHEFTCVAEESEVVQELISGVEVYASNRMKVRIVHDRGRRFLDVCAPKSDKWMDIFAVVAMLDASFRPRTGSFAESVETIARHWDDVLAALGESRPQ